MDGWILICLMVALVITGSGFVQGAMGFGYAIVALAVLPFYLNVRLANLVVSLSAVAPLVLAMWSYRRGLDRRLLAICLSGAVVGLPLGLVVFMAVEAHWLLRGTGLAILIFAIQGLRTQPNEVVGTASRWGSALAGVTSGFLSGSVGIGGPPVAVYAAGQSWSPERFKAFVLSFSLVLVLMKAVGLAATGLLGSDVLWLSVVAAPFGFLGTWLGVRASKNINAVRFRQIAMAMLVLISLDMILREKPSLPATSLRPAITSTTSDRGPWTTAGAVPSHETNHRHWYSNQGRH